jgi:hypothetical protein
VTHDEYLAAQKLERLIDEGARVETVQIGVPDPDPPLFSGKPKPRQVCECSACGRVAVVVCGKCDVKDPT